MAISSVQIPNAPFEISRMTFGAWSIVGGFNWGHQEEKDSRAALRAAYEAGITFFDTAKAYGNGQSERLIADELGDVRDRIIIGTKILPADFAYHNFITDCEDRLQCLNTDYIDLLQLHWPNWDIPIEEPIDALEQLKKEGKIRAYGVSNFGVQDLSEALYKGAVISTNQLPYNLIWRALEYEVLPKCQEENIPVLCYSSIMQGLLAGKFEHASEVPEDRARTKHFSSLRPQTRHGQPGHEELTFDTIHQLKNAAQDWGLSMANMSLAWLLAQPGIGAVIVGARNADQVHRNIKALEVPLSKDQVNELNTITNPLKEVLGPDPDLWASPTRYR